MLGNVSYAICGRGAEFPRVSARRCLTFPQGVYSAPWFSSRSFSSPTRCTGFDDSPPVDYVIAEAQYYHRELPTPPWFRFKVILPFSLNSTNFAEYFVYYFPAWSQLLWSNHLFLAGWRYIFFSLFHWTLQYFIPGPTTSTQTRRGFSRMGVRTHNQSTSRDGSYGIPISSKFFFQFNVCTVYIKK